MSRFEFERIDLAMTSLLDNQPVALESEPANDQCQNASVTTWINLTVSIVVSAMAVFRLVDNFMPSRRQFVH